MKKTGNLKGCESSIYRTFVVMSLLLASCGVLFSGGSKIKVDCSKIDSSTKGQLCGSAVRHILGPVDQIVETVPLDGAELLLLPMDQIDLEDGELIGPHWDPGPRCGRLRESPSPRIVTLDERGQFSELFEPGEYLLCVSYAPPWAPSGHVSSWASISILRSETNSILITYSPMTGILLDLNP